MNLIFSSALLRRLRPAAVIFSRVGARRQGSSLEDALCINEAPALDPEWATADCNKLTALYRSSGQVPAYLEFPESVATTNGTPVWQRGRSTVYIRRSVKYAGMIGTAHTHHWLASWDNGISWDDPLMGWTSSSDPYASMEPLVFPDEKSAVNFCNKNEYDWYIRRDPPPLRNPIVRRYEDNFHWNRRCRVSTR